MLAGLGWGQSLVQTSSFSSESFGSFCWLFLAGWGGFEGNNMFLKEGFAVGGAGT